MIIDGLDNYDYFSIIYGEGPDAVDIGQMVDAVVNIDRGVGNSWTHEYVQGLGRYGQTWTRGRLGSKTISIDFIKEGDQRELSRFRRELAAALDCPNGPKKLTFNDLPNAYYMAVTDGSVSLKEDIRTLRATGTITFTVPDGLLHSSITSILNRNSDDTLGRIVNRQDHVEVEINNPSSVEVYPKISILNTSDNGWIGIVNQNGVMEIGSKEATAKGDQVLSSSVQAETILKASKTNPATWGVFERGTQKVLDAHITSPHDSNMTVRVGKVDYTSRNINYTVGNLLTKKDDTVGSANVTGSNREYVVRGTPTAESKGYIVEVRVRYLSSDIKKMTSTVYAQLYLERVSGNNTFTQWQLGSYLKIGSTDGHHPTMPNMAPQYGGSNRVLIFDGNYTVQHDAAGNATIEVKGAVNGNNQASYVPGYFEVRGSYTLPKINKNHSNTGLNADGTYKQVTQNVAGMSWISAPVPNSAYKWAGGIAVYTLPKDADGSIRSAKNFRCDFNLKFWENKTGQTGRITIGFLDKDDKLICAYDVLKEDQNGGDARVNFYTGKDDIRGHVVFGANNNETNQSKPNVAFNNRTGNASITKEGSKITFTYADKPYTYNVSKLAEKKCAKIYISSGALFAARDLNKMVHVMTVESIQFVNTHGQRYDMIPNRYFRGSRLDIDLYDGVIYFNPNPEALIGNKEQSHLVHGSRFFSVPPGTSFLKIYPSPWCRSLPDVSLEWEDSWL